MLSLLRIITPAPIRSAYHFFLAFLGAIIFGFPGKNITVIGVTGTKGKSSTTEMIAAMLAEGGCSVAFANTIQFSIAGNARANRFKMTTPGRFFLQKFLRDAQRAGCTHAVLELTSEGARQHRHRFLFLDALVVTNLQREHIESHGSYENYVRAKLSIAQELARSKKDARLIVVNAAMHEANRFLSLPIPVRKTFSLAGAAPYHLEGRSLSFTYKSTPVHAPLTGAFNIENAFAALLVSEHFGIPRERAVQALAHLPDIKGRVEYIDCGQNFDVVVDYAHTPDSLRALYEAFPEKRKICVLGNTGGGRDTWKRPEMGAIADSECAEVILTDEDPYDEDPRAIVEAMAAGMKRAPHIIMNRREAIAAALQKADKGDVVLITGKGTDPYIMGARGARQEWSDASVAKEELQALAQRTL